MYQHMGTFLEEILGAVVLGDSYSGLNPKFEKKLIKVLADGNESSDGKVVVDEKNGKLVRILTNVNAKAYYKLYAKKLGHKEQSAKIGSFKEQRRRWSHPPLKLEIITSLCTK
ncbi:uncharacterized protein LOC106766548 [Vigna radiata var. radiata]|uniref:Uncharacterized protein LOC106766548 n=1 Tax=Vigna radiata var. radiata TaxID=3916 RepID=A0A1S3UL35_VIGRR|nr:uncharacterized protein LOC106766548 [Vigna radiata var. radiata]